MANRWGKVETVTNFIFLGSKITTDGDCSNDIKRHLLLGSKATTNVDNLFNYRYRGRLETDSVVGELVEKRG